MNGGIDPRILNSGTRWRWVVSFTPRPPYSGVNNPRYPLDGGLSGPQMQWSEEKISDLTGNRTSVDQFTILTELQQLFEYRNTLLIKSAKILNF